MGHVDLAAFKQDVRGETRPFKIQVGNVTDQAAAFHQYKAFISVKGKVCRFCLYIMAGGPVSAFGLRYCQKHFAFMEYGMFKPGLFTVESAPGKVYAVSYTHLDGMKKGGRGKE